MKQLHNLAWKGSKERPIVMDVHWEDRFEKLPVVILAHGYKGFKDWGSWELMAKEFAKNGFCFLKFNFSFNGGTVANPVDFPDLEAFGKNNYSTELADLKRVLDFIDTSNLLPRNKIDVENITVIGHSRGGGISILAANQDQRIKRLITLASICDLERRQPKGESLAEWKETGVRFVKNGRTKQQMPHYYQMHEDFIKHKDSLDVLQAASEITVPWLIIHGDQDEAVPFSEAEELITVNQNAELLKLPNCNHVFGSKHPWEQEEMPHDFKLMVEACLRFTT